MSRRCRILKFHKICICDVNKLVPHFFHIIRFSMFEEWVERERNMVRIVADMSSWHLEKKYLSDSPFQVPWRRCICCVAPMDTASGSLWSRWGRRSSYSLIRPSRRKSCGEALLAGLHQISFRAEIMNSCVINANYIERKAPFVKMTLKIAQVSYLATLRSST